MDDNAKEFIIAYAALCKKHGLCIAPEAWYGAVCVTTLELGKGWAKDIALSEGVETFEAYQQTKEV